MNIFSTCHFILTYLSFVLVANTLPVDSTATKHVEISDGLTPSNFASTIAEGVWLIEHFSPYCHHCRDFKPTWQQLVDELQGDESRDSGIKLERVDCSAYGGQLSFIYS